jgi:hypothetical protein
VATPFVSAIGLGDVGTGWGGTMSGTVRLFSHRRVPTNPNPTAAAAMVTTIAAAAIARLVRPRSPAGRPA